MWRRAIRVMTRNCSSGCERLPCDEARRQSRKAAGGFDIKPDPVTLPLTTARAGRRRRVSGMTRAARATESNRHLAIGLLSESRSHRIAGAAEVLVDVHDLYGLLRCR